MMHIRTMRELTAEERERRRLEKRLTSRFNKACAEYGLIEDGDKILIGLSGGKDSLALVEMLGRRQKIYVPRFSVAAVHVTIEEIGYQSDTEYLREFCEEHGVEFKVKKTNISQGEEGSRKQKNTCFLCSWYRRKALFDVAKELGCNKIALGHHKDDMVETMIMNLVFQGAFATIPPLLRMDKFEMKMIRPLCLINEAEIKRYSELRGYKQVPKLCPFEKESSRADVKQLIRKLKDMNPDAVDSMWSAMENIKNDYLPKKI